jgi:ferritin
MLSKSMLEALNQQIQLEMSSAYLYLSMATYFEDESLSGFAKWMYGQFGEEQGHARKLYEYIHDRGGRVVLQAIEKPPHEFDSALAVFEQVLEHEQKVTKSIHELYALAVKESDYATQTQLHWFIDEQVEEEKTATDILHHLNRIKGFPQLLLALDQRIATMRED